jgi:hypothetical protein
MERAMTQDDDRKQSDDPLERLGELQRLGQALFEREAERLARKHGVHDPRAQRMIRAAGGAQAMLSALETSRDSAPRVVSAAPDEAVVYGRVASDDLRGAAHVTIMLEDANGRVMRAAGSATTDASGRFTLRIAPAVAKKLSGKELIVTARDTKGEVIYRAAKAVTLNLNTAVETEIDLGPRAPIRRPAAEPQRPDPTRPTEEPGQPSEPERPPRPTRPPEGVTFGVGGQVLRADGKPAAGVLVRIYDRDRKFDDLLGAALTNRNGEFTARYRFQDFSEGETAADLYFVVVDANQTELLSTADRVMFNAEREATVTLTLPEQKGATRRRPK